MSKVNIKDEKPIHHDKKFTRILILGSGFAGIEVLKRLQRKFQKKSNIDITLVSRDNFLLFTPMLHEVSSGMIEVRHIVTPIRTFCKKANFYEANVQSIDLQNKKVVITHEIGKQSEPTSYDQHVLEYDYLVIALGSETNFFGMEDIERHSFTMKTIDDAIVLRNHVINILEQASLEQENSNLRKSLLTFVVVGGGFGGIETVGELNDFVKHTVRQFYKNIFMTDIKIILVNSHDKILPEVGEELGDLELSGYEGQVYALGDCASITDPHTGKPYPPTAQHAIRQGKVAAKNVISSIEGKTKNQKFDYKTKGMMAEIGKRTGVAILLGFKIHGFIAWWLWRTFYLANLPTIKKKLKVIGDWTMDLLFKPDVSMIKRFEKRKH